MSVKTGQAQAAASLETAARGGWQARSFKDEFMTNYWVDVLYRHGTNGDHTRPTLEANTPAPDATGVGLDDAVTLRFDEAVDPAASQIRLTDDGGAHLYGTTTASADGKTLTWQPNGRLSPGTRYTARALAVDRNGNVMASAATWSFTTGPAATCPCSLFSEAIVPDETSGGQGTPVELGVRFGSSTAGAVTSVKFYKTARDTGTHTGSLWTDQGVLLATGTFADETATGWQTLTFATPIPIEANQVYAVSYFSPTGYYAVTPHYFGTRPQVHSAPLWTAPGAYANGRYRVDTGFPTEHYTGNNYWVDVDVTGEPRRGHPFTPELTTPRMK
jgi:methionine-rich copper-binding protein CopC